MEHAFGYRSDAPSLRDFAVWLFRGANPLDPQTSLHPHARVFLRRWQDSQKHSQAFRLWSAQLEGELQIAAALDAQGDRPALGAWDTFELFEKFTLHWLCGGFANGVAAAELRGTMQERRSSFWYPEHEHGYAALEHAIELRELLASAELTMQSVAEGVSRYVASWWRIDRAYRRCAYHLRRYGQVQVMEQVSQWVDAVVINAGDGTHEHPSQALLDAYTLRRSLGELDGRHVAIVGDLAHSRVLRSNLLCLRTLGAQVTLVAPPTLMPAGVSAWAQADGFTVSYDLDEVLPTVDAVMMLRVQRERMSGGYFPTAKEYAVTYGLTGRRLALLQDHAVIAHPGPMNRGLEISADAADAARSLVLGQVSAGVAVRMSILYHLLAGEGSAQ